MNTEFLTLKARSEELNQKMADIRWCLSTMQGIVRKACWVDDFELTPTRAVKRITSNGYHTGYYAVVCISNDDAPYVMVTPSASGRKNIEPTWNCQEVELVHQNLDVVIDACEEFCRRQGREEAFLNMMADLSS